MTFARFFSEFHREESGQDMLEYALVLAVVLTAVVVGTAPLAGTIATELGKIDTAITGLIIP